ncbi:AP endonuclease [Marasmius fiardii PR-910]|nr:AP endonuclease [Marasmius fiardii PR-910]
MRPYLLLLQKTVSIWFTSTLKLVFIAFLYIVVVTVASASKSIAKKTKGKLKAQGESEKIDLENFPARSTSRWKIGAHVSAAGGVENSVLNAAKIGANSFALFLKSQRRWVSPSLTETNISLFKERMKLFSYNPKHILPHGSYLINLGNPDPDKREQSYQCFLDDLKRCDQLGLLLYNFHPGSTLGAVPVSSSITYIAESINRAHKDTPGSKVVAVIENMAGAGNVLGGDFAHLGQIIEQVENKARIGICLDTCHMFAAGYDIRTKQGWEFPVHKLDTDVGLSYLRGMHLNDSKTPCGSNKDRHENIGIGHLKLQTFRHILTDPRVQDIPLVLETPSHEENTGNWDVWKKEIDVLTRLSSEHVPERTNAAREHVKQGATSEDVPDTDMSARSDFYPETSRSDVDKLEVWTKEIEEVVKSVVSTHNTKTRKKKTLKRKKAESEDDQDEDADGDAS